MPDALRDKEKGQILLNNLTRPVSKGRLKKKDMERIAVRSPLHVYSSQREPSIPPQKIDIIQKEAMRASSFPAL